MKKGYKTFHEFEKSDKGHHDKEKHKQEYDEEEGEEKKSHEEAGHYGEEHQGEQGEKNAKFGEEGKHQKGYSTKGEHSVFKKVRIVYRLVAQYVSHVQNQFVSLIFTVIYKKELIVISL